MSNVTWNELSQDLQQRYIEDANFLIKKGLAKQFGFDDNINPEELGKRIYEDLQSLQQSLQKPT